MTVRWHIRVMDEAESKEMRRLFLITGSVSIVLPLLALVLVVVFPSLSEHFQHLNTMNDFTGRNLDICDFIFLGGFVVWFFALGWSWLIFDDFVQDWQARKRHRTYILGIPGFIMGFISALGVMSPFIFILWIPFVLCCRFNEALGLKGDKVVWGFAGAAFVFSFFAASTALVLYIARKRKRTDHDNK